MPSQKTKVPEFHCRGSVISWGYAAAFGAFWNGLTDEQKKLYNEANREKQQNENNSRSDSSEEDDDLESVGELNSYASSSSSELEMAGNTAPDQDSFEHAVHVTLQTCNIL